MHAIRLILLLPAIAFMSGCSTIRAVSETETNDFIGHLEANASQEIEPLIEVGTWIQPENKKEVCKLSFPKDHQLDKWSKIYWDGACKDGYAYGLGREFIVDKDGKTKSAIGEYLGGPQRPNEYAGSDFSANQYAIGDTKERKFLLVDVDDSANYFDINFLILNFDDNAVYSKLTTLASERTVLSKTFKGPDTGYFYETVSHPNGQHSKVFYTKKDGIHVGYSIINDSTGTTYLGVKDGSWERVNLPDSYVARVNMIAASIEEKILSSERYIEEAGKALSRYQGMICQESQVPSFLDIEVYGRICSEHGNLSVFHDKAKRTVELKNYFRQQELAREANKQRLAAENAAHQSREMARLVGGLAEIGSSMNRSSQLLLNQAQIYQAQQPNLTGLNGFGQSSQSNTYGTPIYSESECPGAIVMG